MKAKSGPVSKLLETEDDVEKFIGKADPATVGE